MNHEFSVAKWLRLGMLAIQAGIAVGSLMATGRSEQWLGLYGVLVLVLASVSLWLKRASDRRYQCAEKYRRLLFFSKSNDEEIPAHQLAVIIADYKDADRSITLSEEEYYDSQELPGYRRMLENLQESTFYSRKLASSSAAVFQFVSVVGFGISFVYLLLAALRATPGAASVENLRHAAEISTKLIAFAALGSYFDLWSNFATLERTSDRVYDDASAALLKVNAEDVELAKDSLRLVSTYDCALAASAPIPTVVWLFHRTALQKGWSAIKAKRVNTTTQSRFRTGV